MIEREEFFDNIRNHAFNDELEKVAKEKGKDKVKSYLKHIGTGGALGTAAGGAGGTALSAVSNKAMERITPKFLPKFMKPKKLRVGRAGLVGASIFGVGGAAAGAIYKRIKEDFGKGK